MSFIFTNTSNEDRNSRNRPQVWMFDLTIAPRVEEWKNKISFTQFHKITALQTNENFYDQIYTLLKDNRFYWKKRKFPIIKIEMFDIEYRFSNKITKYIFPALFF